MARAGTAVAAQGRDAVAAVIARHDWAAPLARVLRGLWTDAYAVGWLSSGAVLAHHLGVTKADAPVATVTLGVDWGGWSPGDTDAAKQILGRDDALGHLLSLVDTGDTVADSIVVSRMDRLARTLIDGLEQGLAPATIASQLQGILGDARWAHLVALTETTRAVSQATLARYARNGVAAKEWMTAGDQHVCVPCNTNEDVGAIPLEQAFPDGTDAPPGHPLCRCAIAPAFLSAEEAAAQGADLSGLGGAAEDLAAVVTREAEDILAEAVPQLTEVTGDRTGWAESVAETGLDSPLPVRDVVIRQSTGDYTIAEGWAYKVDGVGYLIERGQGAILTVDEAEARRMVSNLAEFQRGLGEAGRFQKTYTWTTGRNPSDAYWEAKYQTPGFRSSASAAGGDTTLWGLYPRASYDDVLSHEFGHNVDAGARLLGLESDGPVWASASRTRAPLYDWTEKPALRPVTLADEPAALYPQGVTKYGRSSAHEDFAESVRMYLENRALGTGRLVPGGQLQDLYFRDLFPARAKVLDRIFASQASAGGAGGLSAPMVEQDLSKLKVTELRAEAKARGLTGYSKLTKPQLLDLLGRDVEGAAVARQVEIDAARNLADTLAEVHELVANEASARALTARITARAKLTGVDVTGLLAKVGDRDALIAEADRMAAAGNLTRVGEVATREVGPVPFRRAAHELLGPDLREGAPVDIIRPGFTVRLRSGEELVVRRPVVLESTRPLPAPVEPVAIGPVAYMPAMTRAEAEAWSRGSAIPFDLQHGTTAEAAAAIERSGFDIARVGTKTDLGNLGAGFYMNPAGAPSYGSAAGYGETLTLRANVDKVLLTSSREYARARAVENYIDILHSQGEAAARRFLESPATKPTAGTYVPSSGTTNKQLIGRLSKDRTDRYLALRQDGKVSGFVLREWSVDQGYGAIVWDMPGVELPGWPVKDGATWYEINVLNAKDLTVVTSKAPEVTTATDRAALRAAARERNRQIEAATGTERLLAEVDELLAKKASLDVIRERLAPGLTEPGQMFSGADAKVLAALQRAADTGDLSKVRAAVTRQSTAAKLQIEAKAGTKVSFDPALHESVGGVDIPAGTKVVVVRRGASVTLPDGTVLELTKPQVRTLPAPEPKRPPAPDSLRASGRDMSAEVQAGETWLRRAELDQQFGSGTDHVLTTLVRRQDGWSDPARVVTPAELDRVVKSGWTEMWRGVQDWGPGNSAREIAERTRTGEWGMGNGMYGNGVYTTVRRTTAEVYRGTEFAATNFFQGEPWGPAPLYEWLPGFDASYAPKGGLMRMALDPDAKIIDYEELKAEHIAYLRSIDFTSMPDSAYKRTMYDSSAYAVSRGYDGVKIEGPMHNDGAEYPPGVANRSEPPQFIIFNRTVLIFEKASRRYDT